MCVDRYTRWVLFYYYCFEWCQLLLFLDCDLPRVRQLAPANEE